MGHNSLSFIQFLIFPKQIPRENMARALIIFTIIFLIVTICLMIFGDFERNNSKIELSTFDIHHKNLFSKVYSIKKIDSLTAAYNFYFTEENKTLTPSDTQL